MQGKEKKNILAKIQDKQESALTAVWFKWTHMYISFVIAVDSNTDFLRLHFRYIFKFR